MIRDVGEKERFLTRESERTAELVVEKVQEKQCQGI